MLRARRTAAGMYRPLRRALRGMRNRRRKRKGVEVAPTWRRHRRSIALEVLVYIGALLFVLWVVRAVVIVIAGEPLGLLVNPDASCKEIGFSCGVVNGIVMTLLSLALGSALFLLNRLQRVRGPYVQRARSEPAELVPTAGTVIGDVVGRDELCNVIMDDLRDRTGRRPHVIVGGVGTGKTAVLVQLTRVLAHNGAVPVAIRLRDASGGLDFRALAAARFIGQAEGSLLSSGEGERVWRQLCKEDRIVVLADGLEETFAGTDVERDRDNIIRLSIAQARRQGLPLVIASRPHTPLSAMNAAMLDLEPLSQEAALEYLRGDADVLDERLEWLVETAAVADTPLYLQIAKDLHEKGLLRHTHPRRRAEQIDTRGVDGIALRLRLIDTWARALVDGHFKAELVLSRDDRRATLEHLSALACIGLGHDSLHVRFDDLLEHPGLLDALERRLQRRGPDRPAAQHGANCAIAASNGLALGLIEPYRDGVRFQHSIMQAYLGARFLPAILADNNEDFLNAALKEPGRELLMALVMYSRSRFEDEPTRDGDGIRLHLDTSHEPQHAAALRDRLQTAADERHPRDAKTLDLLASALEIDMVVGEPIHAVLATDLAERWREIPTTDRTIEDTKLRAVARLGAAARAIGARQPVGTARPPKPAYLQLFEIGGCDDSYPVRVAAAQEIGVGGDLAFEALHGTLAPTALVHQVRNAVPDAADADADADAPPETSGAATARELKRRSETMRAWLAPMLVGSVSERAEHASRNLDRWLDHVRDHDRPSDGCLPLAVEVGLAQGFKFAANRRPEHPLVRADARDDLAERAREMLERSSFWFSRLTLVHALCLWALPATPQPVARGRRPAPPRAPARAAPVHDSDPEALVRRWLTFADGEPEHPFVEEARKLAVLALQTGQPERFVWIDESGVVMKVGTRPARPGLRRRHHLWIPPSTGWSTLHPRAQQLVGDVLLLLNLAERGRDPIVRDRRLSRIRRNDLPPCLSEQRDSLNPKQTIGTAKSSAPGSNCRHGCKFDLCPYPPKGEQPYRVELSEAFCRRQQTLLGASWLRRGAPWQAALPRELRDFWMAMEQRARR